MNRPPKPTLASIKQFTSSDQIKIAMTHVFQDSQTGISGHRKLVIVMKHIFYKSADINQLEYFIMCFTKMLNRMLLLKKGDIYGDRIAKFISVFIRSLNQDEQERNNGKEKKGEQDDDDDSEEELESPVTKFVESLINHLLRGIGSKDKSIRYRVVQLLSFMIDFISEIHEHIVHLLYNSLEERLQDKEFFIRIVATVAISKFQTYELKIENMGQVKDLSQQLQQKLITLTRYDENADVRRAAYLNLKKTTTTLPYILERAKDLNSINRRLIYSRICRELNGIEHQNYNEYREYLLKWGLNDRDDSVLSAATKLLCTNWYDLVNKNISEFVELLTPRESLVAEKAIQTFFKTRPEIIETIKIDKQFWQELTVDKAFLMRTFYYHCNENRLYDIIDSNFPDATDLSQILEEYLKLRINVLQENEELVKDWEAHKHDIEKIEDRIYFLENEMIGLKFEGDDLERKAAGCQKSIDRAEIVIEVVTKRLKQLDTGKGKLLDLLNDDTRFIFESIQNKSAEDMKKALNNTKTNMKEIKESQEKIISTFQLIKEQFVAYEAEFEEIKENKLRELEKFKQDDKHDYVQFEDQINDLEYIILQLLSVSIEFDFSDEIGRRKILQLIRTTLTEDKLPATLISTALKVLKKISINEKDFVAMSVEIITDIRDSADDDVFHSAQNTFDDEEQATSEKEFPDDLYIRCLIVTQHVLELVEENLDQHLSLSSIYTGIVNYSLTKNDNKALHILGLKCLGLYALIDKNIAKDAVVSFIKFIRTSNDEIKIIGIKSIIDILSIHGISILSKEEKFKYSRLFYKALTSRSPEIQCVVAEGLCKLFLADIFNSEEISDDQDFQSEKYLFEALILIYFHPSIEENEELKQILAFCIPVYSYSKSNHQSRLASVSGDVIYQLFDEENTFITYHNDEEKEEFLEKLSNISPTNVISQLIDWCNPQNLVEPDLKSTSHYWQLVYLLEAFEQDSTKIVKKAILNSLPKFFISEQLGSKLLTSLKDSLLDTKKILDESREETFQLDVKTKRCLDSFIEIIEQKLKSAIENEDKSNTNSILHDISSVDHSNTSNTSNNAINQEKSDRSESEKDDDDVDMEDNETEKESREHTPTPKGNSKEETPFTNVSPDQSCKNSSRTEVSKIQPPSLDDIDKFLDEEDRVEYDIPMVDD
ncbi:unnamed protein product [Candida verbasci]|uniref:Nuclear condensin complex subunit 3 C-terminal domain-containing protein n=1 Tax=Candida verbasci TaxID=1227364 RepID=A0A9W4XDV0_9ASCO|nr:unnamed protein product [Candida verbasci]